MKRLLGWLPGEKVLYTFGSALHNTGRAKQETKTVHVKDEEEVMIKQSKIG